MRARMAGLVLTAASLASAPLAAAPRGFEAAVFSELNRLRADPAGMIPDLEDYRDRFDGTLVYGDAGEADFMTREGVAAVDEAMDALDRAPAVPRLATADLLARAAADHVAAQARSGQVGHMSNGRGPPERATARGGGRFVGEVITYGHISPASVVRQLVVDDGVPNRGHRIEILSARYRYAGVACGAHPKWRTMCVIMLSETPDGSPPPPPPRRQAR